MGKLRPNIGKGHVQGHTAELGRVQGVLGHMAALATVPIAFLGVPCKPVKKILLWPLSGPRLGSGSLPLWLLELSFQTKSPEVLSPSLN